MGYVHKEILSKRRNSASTGDKKQSGDSLQVASSSKVNYQSSDLLIYSHALRGPLFVTACGISRDNSYPILISVILYSHTRSYT